MRIDAVFGTCGFSLSGEQAQKFSLYREMLIERNKVMNLTAITDPDEILVKHFLDSALPLGFCEIPDGASVVDIGAGAGFPSLPMKILRPDLRLTMVDSLGKRVDFLRDVCAALEIEAECLHIRAEDAGREALRERFDVSVARAVSRLPSLCEYCLPTVKVGGVMLALKGGDCKDELKSAYTAIKTLGGRLESSPEYSLPNGDERTLAIIKKVSPTPRAYPRPQGKIKAKPL